LSPLVLVEWRFVSVRKVAIGLDFATPLCHDNSTIERHPAFDVFFEIGDTKMNEAIPLAFPTMAERAIAEWKALPKTKPFEFVALAKGAFREDRGFLPHIIEWVFPDDTSVTIVGRGKAHQIESHLP